jgi:hypothetical protein
MQIDAIEFLETPHHPPNHPQIRSKNFHSKKGRKTHQTAQNPNPYKPRNRRKFIQFLFVDRSEKFVGKYCPEVNGSFSWKIFLFAFFMTDN